MDVEVGQEVELSIDRLGYGGVGVGRVDGYTIFAPRTAPGDVARVELTQLRKRYAHAAPLEIIEPGPHRIEPHCAHYAECGGCHFQHLEYEETARNKEKDIADNLERIGPGKRNVRPIFRPQDVWGYRNRAVFHHLGKGIAGYVSWRKDRVIPIDRCEISNEKLNLALIELKSILEPFKGTEVPYFVLRKTAGDRFSIVFSVSKKKGSKLVERIDQASEKLSNDISRFVSVIKEGAHSPFGEEIFPLGGAQDLEETIFDLKFAIEPDSFFQIHGEVTKTLLSDTCEAIGPPSEGTVLDLHCGVGLFSLALAQKGHSVLGVEAHYPSTLMAAKNAKRNQLDHLSEFRAGKAERIANKLWKKGERFSTVLVDPPRRGLASSLIEDFPSLGVERLLYVSCSPPTLARDAKRLEALGYKLQWVQPYDMFPQTYHVEALSFFSRE